MKEFIPTDLGQPTGPISFDRIFVRDYVRDVEIGAFQSERGVTQRLRFTIVLELAPSAVEIGDDVDRVVSYDRLVKAIDSALAQDRLNLLETLAEAIAADCLASPRSERVSVRIEKLDRIDGALGVEILRTRDERGGSMARGAVGAAQRIEVVALEVDDTPEDRTGQWLDAILGRGGPAIVCLRPIASTPKDADLRISLLGITQAAWTLARHHERLTVAGRWAELDWAVSTGRVALLAPDRIVMDAVSLPGWIAAEPLPLATWVAARLNAGRITVAGVGEAKPLTPDTAVVVASTPQDLPPA